LSTFGADVLNAFRLSTIRRKVFGRRRKRAPGWHDLNLQLAQKLLTFRFSITYLMALFGALIVDHSWKLIG
jgi:heme O synthase-like polyprenyltransferase